MARSWRSFVVSTLFWFCVSNCVSANLSDRHRGPVGRPKGPPGTYEIREQARLISYLLNLVLHPLHMYHALVRQELRVTPSLCPREAQLPPLESRRGSRSGPHPRLIVLPLV